jgi:FkbM family methyltransferase
MQGQAILSGKRLAVTDAVAYLSRRMARGYGRKFAQMLFRYYPAKTGTAVLHDFDGDLSILVDRASYISSAIYWSGHHSLNVIKFLDIYLRPEMAFADIGANIGEVTLYAAKRLSHGRVLSFEPSPAIFAQLSRNVALNHFPQVEVFNIGLYDREDVLPFFVEEENLFGMANHGLGTVFGAAMDKQTGVVRLRKFDDVAVEAGLQRLDFLKVDVEGAEWMVLKGAEECIRRFRPVIVAESSAGNFERAGYAPKDLYQYLESLGYQIRNLEDGSTHLPAECDVLCVPAAKAG